VILGNWATKEVWRISDYDFSWELSVQSWTTPNPYFSS